MLSILEMVAAHGVMVGLLLHCEFLNNSARGASVERKVGCDVNVMHFALALLI